MNKTDIAEGIEHITTVLRERYKPEKVILFGSAAWGREHIHDIDLFIIKKDVPYYGSDRIAELYHLMDTDLPVDYLVYTPEEVEKWLALGDPFIIKIVNEGKVLYG